MRALAPSGRAMLVTLIQHPVESANIIRAIGGAVGAASDAVAQLGNHTVQP